MSAYPGGVTAFSFIPRLPVDDAGEAPPTLAPLARRISPAWLVGLLFGWIALDNLLLWQFLGSIPPLAAVVGAALSGLLVGMATRAIDGEGPTVATLLACVAIAGLLLAIGGEGRLFYANPDWRVRDALLADMVRHGWPFTYATPDGVALLRAPIAMYLVPALGGKLGGQSGGDLALLAQNALLFGTLLAVGSTLFATTRARLAVLACFLAFSGMDIVGQLLGGHGSLLTPTAHLEPWSVTQYSSTITLLFWVPQHAFAGWCGALAVLLWRAGRLRCGVPLALFPLLLLWSPLAGMGLIPFMVWIGLDGLVRRRARIGDVAMVGAALVLAIPALLYLKSGGEAVGSRIFPIAPDAYLLFELIEVIPLLLIAAAGWKTRFGGPLYAIVALSLLLIPFGQIGWSIDFAMRASIPALAILAVILGDLLAGRALSAMRRPALIGLLLIGGLTGLAEIARGLTFPVSPPPRCPLSSEWLRYADFAVASSSYAAPLTAVPPSIRPHRPAIVPLQRACREPVWPAPALFH